MARTLVVAYVLLILLLTWSVRESGTPSFYKAARELGANTRLTEADLREQPVTSLDDRLRLRRELHRLVGQYLVQSLQRDEQVKADNVSKWPDLKDVAVTPVMLDAEPDQRVLNHGSVVEVSIGDSHKQLEVVAIVLSDAKWLALFRKAEIGEISGTMKVERVIALPAGASASTPSTSTPANTPQKPANAAPATPVPSATPIPAPGAPVSGSSSAAPAAASAAGPAQGAVKK